MSQSGLEAGADRGVDSGWGQGAGMSACPGHLRQLVEAGLGGGECPRCGWHEPMLGVGRALTLPVLAWVCSHAVPGGWGFSLVLGPVPSCDPGGAGRAGSRPRVDLGAAVVLLVRLGDWEIAGAPALCVVLLGSLLPLPFEAGARPPWGRVQREETRPRLGGLSHRGLGPILGSSPAWQSSGAWPLQVPSMLSGTVEATRCPQSQELPKALAHPGFPRGPQFCVHMSHKCQGLGGGYQGLPGSRGLCWQSPAPGGTECTVLHLLREDHPGLTEEDLGDVGSGAWLLSLCPLLGPLPREIRTPKPPG